MNSILACHLTVDHIGRSVAFYAAGKRVCGRLDDYCRHTGSYSLMVGGIWHRRLSTSAEIDVLGEVAA